MLLEGGVLWRGGGRRSKDGLWSERSVSVVRTYKDNGDTTPDLAVSRTHVWTGGLTGLEPSKADLEETNRRSLPPATHEVTEAPYKLPLVLAVSWQCWLTRFPRSNPDVMSAENGLRIEIDSPKGG